MTHVPQRSLDERRDPVLDGVRGLAIVAVLLHHFCLAYTADGVWLDRVAFGIADSLWCGVDLFFVLSGFLITGILVDSKGGPHFLRNFYARRTLRIFPLYYACLFAFYIAFPRIPHPAAQDYIAPSVGDQAWFWTYLTNFKLVERGGLYDVLIPNIFWSLAIEEQFYLVWPFVVLALSRRALTWVAGSLVAIALAVRCGLAASGAPSVASFALPFARMDCLAAGALLALALRSQRGLPSRRTGYAVLAGLGVALLAMSVPFGGLRWGQTHVHTVGFTLVAVAFTALVALALPTTSPDRIADTSGSGDPRSGPLRRALGFGPLRFLGKYSYGLYIVHGPIATFTKLVYDPQQMPLVMGSAIPRVAVHVLLASVFSVVAAIVSWNLLERHFLKLKHYFEGREPSLVPVPRAPGKAPLPEPQVVAGGEPQGVH